MKKPGFCGSDAAVAEQPIICAARVRDVINEMHFEDRFSGSSKILASRSYIAQWPDAIAGEGKAIDEQGGIQKLKIFVVPFSKGEIKASIIGGIIRSEDGAKIHEFITTVGIADEGIDIGSSIIPADRQVSEIDIVRREGVVLHEDPRGN